MQSIFSYTVNLRNPIKKKLFVSDYPSYADPFLQYFSIVPTVKECDVVLFTGGSDIDPAFYGAKAGSKTYTNPPRDARWKQYYLEARDLNKKFLGICRGHQFLCAMAGGILAQHIENHEGNIHRIVTSEGDELPVNSLHHQMAVPGDIPHELLAWTENLSHIHLDGEDKNIPNIEVEPEVIWFPELNGLGIQCHPEMMPAHSHFFRPTLQYFHKLVEERLL